MTSKEQSLLIRADATAEMGTGHVMRCLALAQAWKDAGGEVTFACTEIAPGLAARLQEESIGLQRVSAARGTLTDADRTARIACGMSADWIVLDGYQFGADYQRRIKELGCRLLAIDDYGHAGHYRADYVLNPNGYATADFYESREPETRLLLGTRFVLLRREFRHWRGWRKPQSSAAGKILVTLGGSDPDHVTLKVVEALRELQSAETEVIVVAGASYSQLDALKAAVETLGPNGQLRVNAADMPELMAWASVAISAAGTTCWELAFMQLPALLLILADNQKRGGEYAARSGFAVNLGMGALATPRAIAATLSSLMEDASARRQMAERGSLAVDGLGGDRIVDLLMRPEIRLRRARREDARLLWEWRRDPEVMRTSFSTGELVLESHVVWLTSKLQDPACELFIAELPDGSAIGQVRFDVHDGQADISVSLGREHRGKGYGAGIIVAGCECAFESLGINIVNAYVKPDNAASVQAFIRSGFQNNGEILVKGNPALHLMLNRESLP